MAFPLSPGITTTERDLTTSVPAVATTEAGIPIIGHWGPVDEITLVTTPDELLKKFGKPTTDTAARWFTAENFLAYSRSLYVVRSATTIAKNAVSSGTAILIKNDDDYDSNYSDGEGSVGPWAGKFAGEMGNSLFVGICGSAAKFNNDSGDEWTYTKPDGTVVALSDLFDGAPGTSVSAAAAGAVGDEIHVVVIDHLGEFTGTPGQVLEKHQFLSVASDAKKEDGSSNFYKTVINRRSPYIRVMDKPTNGTNWDTVLADGTTYTDLAIDDAEHAIQLESGANDSGSFTTALSSGYDLLNDPDKVDISFLLGADADATIAAKVYDSVVKRKDTVGVISPEKSDVVNNSGSEKTDVLAYRDTLSFGGVNDLKPSYMEMTDNWKYQYNRFDDTYIWVPDNGDIAGLMAETDKEEGAGFSPGGKGIRNVIKLAWSAKKEERDELYKKGINSVVSFPGEGAVLYGDKTMMVRPSAFDRINVRRIFIEMKKSISRSARSFLFKNNNTFTRNRFLATVRPYLEGKKGRGEITDFRIVCDGTNNTSDVLQRNEFVGDIYVKPAYSINFIQLNFVAVNTDVEFEEIIKGL